MSQLNPFCKSGRIAAVQGNKLWITEIQEAHTGGIKGNISMHLVRKKIRKAQPGKAMMLLVKAPRSRATSI